PAYRVAVRRRLLPGFWRRLFAARPHRGHPAFWAAVGAAAALLVVLALPRGEPPCAPGTPPPAAAPSAAQAAPCGPLPAGVVVAEQRREIRREERRVAREDRAIRPMQPPVELP